MKKIGIVGGIAWRSTVEYYAALCRLSEQYFAEKGLRGVPPTPEITIESLDLRQVLSHMGKIGDEASWERFDAYHRDALTRLKNASVELAIIASNTPHHRFDTIAGGLGIPVLDIFSVIARESALLRFERVLILGTELTMSSVRFERAFLKYGVVPFAPNNQERLLVTALIGELQSGRSPGADRLIGSVARAAFLREAFARPVVCLACTELPLAFPNASGESVFEIDGIRYLNTGAIHAKAAFELAVR